MYFALLFCIFLHTVTIGAIRMLVMDVPASTSIGQNAELTCTYDLESDQLYSIKWYRNDVEFYRFVPQDWPPGQFLPLPGIKVDLAKSGKNSVLLKRVDINTAGTYRCEVSAEAPSFKTVEAEKEMKIYVLPTQGPTVTGGEKTFNIGDSITLNCNSSKSKPAASLRWFINGKPVGAEYETKFHVYTHEDKLDSSSLGLRFLVDENMHRKRVLRIRCSATIGSFYSTHTDKILVADLRMASANLEMEDEAQDHCCTLQMNGLLLTFALMIAVTLLKRNL